MKAATIIISRTDAIGDVVLTLPMAGIIKDLLGADTKIIFFGKSYTQPVIESCTKINEFLNYDAFSKLDEAGKIEFLKATNADAIIHVFPKQDISAAAKLAGIKKRIGATGRLHHWFNCNRLVRMSRKKSDLHEAQLNVKLLKPLGHSGNISTEELAKHYSMQVKGSVPAAIKNLLSNNKFKLIIHPKSNASAREWSLENYSALLKILPAEKIQFIITGGENEKSALDEWHKALSNEVVNLAGKMSLLELIALLNEADGIVAASTGPLHIAAALGKHTLGIYPPIRPMDPGRWAPVGDLAEFIVLDKNCTDCRFKPSSCYCINEITAQKVSGRVVKWL